MDAVSSPLDRLAQELPELLELRRHLHAHPELSGEEHQTAALVAGELRSLGWRVQEGVGRTGVVAEPVSYTHLRAHETDSYLV